MELEGKTALITGAGASGGNRRRHAACSLPKAPGSSSPPSCRPWRAALDLLRDAGADAQFVLLT